MITFNGHRLSNYVVIRDIGRQIMPVAALTLLDIQGRDGSYYFKKRKEARVITAEVMLIGQTKAQIRRTAEELAEILDTKEPAPLQFDDQPGVEYSAIVSGSTDISENAFTGTSVITFLCPDPHGVGASVTTQITSGGTMLTNNGNAEAYPKYEVFFDAPATFFSLIHPDGITMVGNPTQADKVTVPAKEQIFFDDANDLTQWTVNTGINVDDGIATGAVQSISSRITPTDYGANATGWHGPALKHSFGQNVQDFQVDFQLSLKASNRNQIGQLELYFLDQNNNVIFVNRARDFSPTYEDTHLQWRGGNLSNGEALLIMRGFELEYYKDSSLFMRTIRKGNKLTMYSHKFGVDGGRKHYYTKVMDLPAGKFSAPIASIVLYFAAYKTNPAVASVNLEKITAWKLNTVTSIDIPGIFEAGDVLTIDTYTGKVTKNGLPFYEYLDPESTFPPIGPGTTEMQYVTNDQLQVTVMATHKERWK